MQTNRTLSRRGSEPTLYWLKWTDDRQAHHYWENGGSHVAGCLFCTDSKVGKTWRDGERFGFCWKGRGNGKREEGRRVSEGEKERGNGLTGSKSQGDFHNILVFVLYKRYSYICFKVQSHFSLLPLPLHPWPLAQSHKGQWLSGTTSANANIS